MQVEGIFSALRNNLRGLSAQMKRLETISENIANAERVPGTNGKLYHRKVVRENTPGGLPQSSFGDRMALKLRVSNDKHLARIAPSNFRANALESTPRFEVEEIRDVRLEYDPSNPQANADGYVVKPNVNIVEEMVELVSASRSYEANVTVMTAAKQMAKNILKI